MAASSHRPDPIRQALHLVTAAGPDGLAQSAELRASLSTHAHADALTAAASVRAANTRWDLATVVAQMRNELVSVTTALDLPEDAGAIEDGHAAVDRIRALLAALAPVLR